MAKEMSLLDAIMNAPSSGVVDRPKPVPTGSYLAKLVGQPEYGKTETKGTDFIQFQGEFIEPYDDVDQDDLANWAKRANGSARKLKGTSLPRRGLTFYITEDAKWRLEKFFEDLGVFKKGETLRDMVENAIGQEFVVSIEHELSNDGQVTYANIRSTAPAE
jgi:hypothetical protein